MKRLLFVLLTLAVVPVFADNTNFVYYGYDYDPGYYDEYWYSDYWYDGYWVYMPYGYYCVRFVWWYPWWWDWYWARCYWCHRFHWDFFYAGFYVVWYDHGTWWYRPRYGQYVRYRLPYSYAVLRVKARTQGIYLPDKPPREVNLPYRENTVMTLVRQNDPELYARVEREHRSGNLEQMRTKYVKQVNHEIATKNREHGIESRAIDINQLVNREKPIAWTSTENPVRMSQPARSSQPVASRNEQSRIETPSRPAESGTGASRIQKEDKNAPNSRATTAPSRPAESGTSTSRIQKQDKNESTGRANTAPSSANRSSSRVEPGRPGQTTAPSQGVQRPGDSEKTTPGAGKAQVESEKHEGGEKRNPPAPARQLQRNPVETRERAPDDPNSRAPGTER
ncbi:hypothetical protein IBX73_01400 [candidate division WOR-3 bacterium]|nr:hypothetical protein [candidate division WOR-3 bacterium]